MRLHEAEFIRLLPAWMRGDEATRGLAAGADAVTRALAARIRLLSRWNRIDQMGDAELDEMAWELNIAWYRSTASLDVKRAVVKSSDLIYARLGTTWAVEQIIIDYFGTGRVLEWFDYGGEPYHFKVQSDNPALTGETYTAFLTLLAHVKRAGAWLDAIEIDTNMTATLHAGGVLHPTYASINLPPYIPAT